jgi:hypothetical protein
MDGACKSGDTMQKSAMNSLKIRATVDTKYAVNTKRKNIGRSPMLLMFERITGSVEEAQ